MADTEAESETKAEQKPLTVDQKQQILSTEFKKLRDYYVQHGFDDKVVREELIKHVRKSENLPKQQGRKSENKTFFTTKFICFFLVPVFLSIIVGLFVYNPGLVEDTGLSEYIYTSPCILDNNIFTMEVTRPLFDCGICQDLKEAPVVKDISKEEFLDKYAFTTVPVLVKDATVKWTALQTFSFKYFQDIYLKNKDALKAVEEDCQFFPYKTEFDSLRQVFEMPEDRAAYKDGEKPWYVGWSNCHPDIQKELRSHYQRPYFLPDESESSALDWIFMGGPGLGAFVHIDSVKRPSWQAQIRGRKTWTLIPPPECESVCVTFNVTMAPGDIIVVDTNQWYHSTYVHEGDISITIGSEFD